MKEAVLFFRSSSLAMSADSLLVCDFEAFESRKYSYPLPGHARVRNSPLRRFHWKEMLQLTQVCLPLQFRLELHRFQESYDVDNAHRFLESLIHLLLPQV